MKKIIICISLILTLTFTFTELTTAQNDNKFELKLSYSGISSTLENERELLRSGKIKPHIRLNGAYNINRNFGVGLYFGYSSLNHFHPNAYESTFTDSNGISKTVWVDGFDATKSYFYGLNLNFHLFPAIFKIDNSRFDLYTTAKVGAVTENWRTIDNSYDAYATISKHSLTKLEYSAGFGLSYFLTKKIGLFGEYDFGKFINDDNMRFYLGVAYKF